VPANNDGLWPQLLSQVAGCACSAWRSADTMLRDAPGFGVAFDADFIKTHRVNWRDSSIFNYVERKARTGRFAIS
jgi:hypothetical protein